MSNTSVDTHADAAPLLKGWGEDPADNDGQLTHAVSHRRRHVAICGTQVAVLGEPWPDWSRRTTMPRCSTCTQAATPRS